MPPELLIKFLQVFLLEFLRKILLELKKNCSFDHFSWTSASIPLKGRLAIPSRVPPGSPPKFFQEFLAIISSSAPSERFPEILSEAFSRSSLDITLQNFPYPAVWPIKTDKRYSRFQDKKSRRYGRVKPWRISECNFWGNLWWVSLMSLHKDSRKKGWTNSCKEQKLRWNYQLFLNELEQFRRKKNCH